MKIDGQDFRRIGDVARWTWWSATLLTATLSVVQLLSSLRRPPRPPSLPSLAETLTMVPNAGARCLNKPGRNDLDVDSRHPTVDEDCALIEQQVIDVDGNVSHTKW